MIVAFPQIQSHIVKANQKEWITKVVASNSALQASQERHAAETLELREQIKDLMFHLQVTVNFRNIKLSWDIFFLKRFLLNVKGRC